MADFIFIDNLSQSGKMAISYHVFDQLVTHALEQLPDVSMSQKKLKKNQRIRLNRPVQTTIHHGIAHVWVSVDLKEGTNIQEASQLIQQKVIDTFLISADQVPFDVQVKVESFVQ